MGTPTEKVIPRSAKSGRYDRRTSVKSRPTSWGLDPRHVEQVRQQPVHSRRGADHLEGVFTGRVGRRFGDALCVERDDVQRVPEIVRDDAEHVVMVRLLAAGVLEGLSRLAQRRRGRVRAASLLGELLVRVLPVRLLPLAIQLLLAPLDFDARVGSLALPLDVRIRDAALRALAVVGDASLQDDGPIQRRRRQALVGEQAVVAQAQAPEARVREESIVLDEVVDGALRPRDLEGPGRIRVGSLGAQARIRVRPRLRGQLSNFLHDPPQRPPDGPSGPPGYRLPATTV
jgi:hypothetical protein